MAQCSVQGSYGWVRWHAASPCLSRWQLWKISPLSAHTHTHTLYCLHKYTHTHNALLHNYAHSTADKVASMIPVRAHCSGYIYVQHAHKHVHNQMCAQCANKHIVVVAGTQHTTHVYRGCLPRPLCTPRSKDKITKYQSYVCLTSFSMGELFFTTPSSYYSSYPNFHNQMGKGSLQNKFLVKVGILAQPAWPPPPSPNVGIPKKEKKK